MAEGKPAGYLQAWSRIWTCTSAWRNPAGAQGRTWIFGASKMQVQRPNHSATLPLLQYYYQMSCHLNLQRSSLVFGAIHKGYFELVNLIRKKDTGNEALRNPFFCHTVYLEKNSFKVE